MADSAPPNYNPNDSMLSGGIDTPIMKVMGGGGGLGGGLNSGGSGGLSIDDDVLLSLSVNTTLVPR